MRIARKTPDFKLHIVKDIKSAAAEGSALEIHLRKFSQSFSYSFFPTKILKLIAVKSFVWPQQKGTFIADIMDCRVWLVSQHLKHNLYYYLHDKELI